MKTWGYLLAPLLVWVMHFGSVYLCAEFAPAILKAIVPILTGLGLCANLYFFIRAADSRSWHTTILRRGSLISSIAIVWQALPIYL